MATMHIKNKYELSFDELVKETNQRGGVPKELTVEPKEAWAILQEMHDMGQMHSQFNVSDGTEELSKRLEASAKIWNSVGPIDVLIGKQLIKDWYLGHYGITFKGIPLRMVPEVKITNPAECFEPKPKSFWQRLKNGLRISS